MQGHSSARAHEGPLSEVPKEGLRRIWLWAVLIAIGGFLFGFDTGVISGALLYIREDFGLNSFQQSSVVSVLVLGAMVGALGSGRYADRLGRRRLFLLEGLLFLAGTGIAVLASGYWMLLAGRLILGLAVGAASATVPVYLSEISPKEIRGRVLTLNQLMITVGILVSYLTNLAFAGGGHWRAMIGVGAVPAAVIVLAAVWVLPESPTWQLSHGRRREAHRLFASLTNDATADRLVEKYVRTRERSGTAGGWRTLLRADVRPALVVGLMLAAIQQFGGINTIIYYAPTIIEQTGLTASNSIFYSVAIGIINLVMTLVAIRVIDRFGRRPLLLVSLLVMSVTMVLLGLSFIAGWSSELSLLFMVLYIAGYAVGLGPVFWTLIGEIFTPRARAAGSSASTAMNWLANFLVSLVFLPIAHLIGQGQTFWIFAVIAAVGLAFVGRYVPETKERDFPEVDAEIQTRFGRDAPTGE